MRLRALVFTTLAVGLCITLAGHAPSGAIFTTTDNGSRVNANIYGDKSDVYLDGGPGPNALQGSAGLDDGIYVFQVTDPSGQTLLSTDKAACRVVEVGQGVIRAVLDWDGSGISSADFSRHDFPGGALGSPSPSDKCHSEGKSKSKHDANQDIDHGPPAIVVQLMPYATTPNPGGVYKAWMIPIVDFVAGCQPLGLAGDSGLNTVNCGYAPANFHGFLPAHSKMDTFKVKEKAGKPRPTITVFKFCDVDCDSQQNVIEGNGLEPGMTGTQITITDVAGNAVCSGPTVGGFFSCTLPATGTFTVTETVGSDFHPCGVTVDLGLGAGPNPIGVVASAVVMITQSDQAATVTFGNGPLGMTAGMKTCATTGAGIDGVIIDIRGTAGLGAGFVASTSTSNGGSFGFAHLLPGTYQISEVVPPGFAAIGPTSCAVTLAVNTNPDPNTGIAQCVIPRGTCNFQNVAVGSVGARTPGFWCNQVQWALGANPGDNAACYTRLTCEFGSIQNILNAALRLWVSRGGSPALFDLDGNGTVSLAEAQMILCPQAGDGEHEQCRRQLFALLLNLAGQRGATPSPSCGSGCSEPIGVSLSQRVVVNAQLTTVGAVLDSVVAAGGCSPALGSIVQGINENTITVLSTCPSRVQ